ncbi:MAG: methyltransferase domain-containing protein [Gammaproteobacteria bacterium]|nr:methyltransferase domain-containing protein [Gammaproteobacteria bacterium]
MNKKSMMNISQQLINHGVHPYGSAEVLKFEKQLARYFGREYERWQGNKNLTESYGLNSFEGDISKSETRPESLSHYNEEYHVYRAFLDKDYLAYTMGCFGVDSYGPELKDISLEQAQMKKYELLVERADIQDGQSIIDLGCGFGGLSKYLLETYPNIKVTGINPSEVQTGYIRKELMSPDNNFDHLRFRLIQAYFDDVDSLGIELESFDRVISIGFLEHVSNIDLLQKKLSRLLKPGGLCMHHCIVSVDVLPAFLNSEDTLMGAYYPGAHIWPLSEPPRHNTHLTFKNSWFVNGMNYWKTLDEWHKRFWESIDQIYPEYLTTDEVDNWNKYFSLCKAMFIPNDGKSYGNGHFLYQK